MDTDEGGSGGSVPGDEEANSSGSAWDIVREHTVRPRSHTGAGELKRNELKRRAKQSAPQFAP